MIPDARKLLHKAVRDYARLLNGGSPAQLAEARSLVADCQRQLDELLRGRVSRIDAREAAKRKAQLNREQKAMARYEVDCQAYAVSKDMADYATMEASFAELTEEQRETVVGEMKEPLSIYYIMRK